MTDLGNLHFFLGIEASRFATHLFFTQYKYLLSVITIVIMLDCKLVPTPIVSGKKFSIYDGDLLADHTKYYRIVGALQYLSFT